MISIAAVLFLNEDAQASIKSAVKYSTTRKLKKNYNVQYTLAFWMNVNQTPEYSQLCTREHFNESSLSSLL